MEFMVIYTSSSKGLPW